MRIALLAEGDAETRNCWSGSALSVVRALRSRGHEVICCDVDLYGLERAFAALRSFSPRRKRWSSKYHLGGASFELRSRRATRLLPGAGNAVDAVLQIGATFAPRLEGDAPLVLYCDSNILLASHAQKSLGAVSDFQQLSRTEVAVIQEREAAVYREARVLFTMSERLRRSFLEDFDVSPEKIHTVHAGPNLEQSQIPRRIQGSRPPTILFVGRAFERKGGDVLLAAFARVRREIPDARLLIVGPARIEAPPPGVVCLGYLDKETSRGWKALCDAYAGADVFCLPTRFEPFGIAFLEAMFFGLPCVGPDEWAVPEIIRDGATGFLAPPGDDRRFAERIISLLADRVSAERMGLEGRRIAEERFTWQATIDRMLAVLGPIVGETSIVDVDR